MESTNSEAEASVARAPLSDEDTAWTISALRQRLEEETGDRAVQARDHRRAVTQRVREAREKLTSSSGTRLAFDLELARGYAQNCLATFVALFALEAAIATIITAWLPVTTAALWLGCVSCCHALTLVYARRFLADTAGETPLKVWIRRFAMAEFARAAAFAAIVPPLGMVSSESARIFLVFAMLVVMAVRTILSASIPIVMYLGSLPITLALAAFFLLAGGPQALTVVLIAPLAQIFLIVLSRRLFHSSLVTLQYRAEKDALIAELEQAKSISDEARRHAELANVAKSRFLATMSHELRTPLNAILGFSEVLKTEVFGAHAVPTYKEYASDIHASGEHLLNLINELLDLSRIEAGRYELNEEAVRVCHIVENCCHLLKLRARNRGITLTQSFTPNMNALWADERAVRQVALNLLSNAIKFTPQSGEITVTVGITPEGGQFLSVKDTGPGIPEKEIPVVLSSFGQGTLAIKTAEQGAGLGLPIVKGLVDLHGGSFELKSKLREGTEAIVTFPPSRVVAALGPLEQGPDHKLRRAG